jgi:hypothetical protein
MTHELTLADVEQRVRATLQAKSGDCGAGHPGRRSANSGSESEAIPTAAPLPVRSAGGVGPRLVVAATAAVVFVVAGGLAVRHAHRHSDPVISAEGDQTREPSASSGDAAPTACGTELPVTVTVPGAVEGPVPGPVPGGAPAQPGQVIVHWQRADDAIEARWPADPQPVYDLSGASQRPNQEMSSAMTEDPPKADIDIDADGFDSDLVVEGRTQQPPACNVLELVVITREGRTPLGLRLSSDPETPDAPYGWVDLQPIIIERREVDDAPDEAIPCQAADTSGTPDNRSGGSDPDVRGDTPAATLHAFLANESGAMQSGYVEMIEPDGSIAYGVDPNSEGWTTLVTVVSDPAGWHLDHWTMSGC